MKNAFAPYRRLGITAICAVAVLTLALGGFNQANPKDQEIL